MRSSVPILVLAATMVVFAACGTSDTDPVNPTAAAGNVQVTPPSGATAVPTSIATPRPLPTSSDPLLTSALATAADLGPGWEEQPLVGTNASLADNFYCGNRFELPTPGALAAYRENGGSRRNMFEQLITFPSDAEAQAFLERLRGALSQCTSLVSTDGRARTEWNVSIADFQPFGDESVATLARANVGGQRAAAYTVLVRDGGTVMIIATLQSDDIDRAATEALVSGAYQRYVEAVGG